MIALEKTEDGTIDQFDLFMGSILLKNWERKKPFYQPIFG